MTPHLAAIGLEKSYHKGKIKVPAGDNPGPQPDAPDAANCASASALSVTIPASQPPVTASPTPAATGASPKSSTSPTPKSSTKASATPRAAG